MNFTPFTYFNKRPQITYVGYTNSNTSLLTYTFNDLSVGESGLSVICVGSEISGSTGRTVTSITVDGVNAIQATQSLSGLSSTGVASAIYYLRRTNPTASVAISFNTAPARCLVSIFNITNNESDTPEQSRINTANSGTGLSASFSGLSASSVGVVNYTIGLDSVTGLGWSNATERFNLGSGTIGQTRFSAADFFVDNFGNRIVSVTHSNSTQPLAYAGVVWR